MIGVIWIHKLGKSHTKVKEHNYVACACVLKFEQAWVHVKLGVRLGEAGVRARA